MSIRFGPLDPLQLIFGIMNHLMKSNNLSYDQAREIIRQALPPEMPEDEKNKILDSLVKHN